MEEFTQENVYLIDLSRIETIPEIIFELSSVLEKKESKNRRIFLKLGGINLNEAQILSVKSLINGADSSLAGIGTKSIKTERTALSLGITVSDAFENPSPKVIAAVPDKTPEKFKNKTVVSAVNEEITADPVIIEETGVIEPENAVSGEDDTVIPDAEAEIIENEREKPGIKAKPREFNNELDIIFGSNPIEKTIFNKEQPKTDENNGADEVLGDIEPSQFEYTKDDAEIEVFPTKYIKQTVRSGQVINFEGNIVIIGDCHPGSEINALGDITVWGVLSGIAHAGSGGNKKARVRALRMNAVQVRIAECYSRRPDALNTIFAEKTNSFTPEEARIINGEIVVFKMND